MRRDGSDDGWHRWTVLGTALALVAIFTLAVPAHAVAVANTVAGGGSGDGLPAGAVGFSASDFAVDASGNVVLADDLQRRLRRVDAGTGLIGPYPAPGVLPACDDFEHITDACLDGASSLAVAPGGDVLVGDTSGRVLRIAAGTGAVTRVAGLPNTSSATCAVATPAHATVPALDACLETIWSVDVDAAGNVFVAEGISARVRRIDAATGMLTTIAGIDAAGPDCKDGDLATMCFIGATFRIAADAAGNVFLANPHQRRVRRVDAATGRITTIVGADRCMDAERSGPYRACTDPIDVAVDATGSVYVLERDGRVRRVEARRRPRIATVARVLSPAGLALDPSGHPYVLYDDTPSPFAGGKARIARIDVATGALTPVAGNGSQSSCGDGGPALAACLDDPRALAVAPDGAVIVAELGGSNRIRRVDPVSGTIVTIAGDGTTSSGTRTRCPDGVPATTSCFNELGDVTVDGAGNVFIVDVGDAFEDAPEEPTRLRRIDATTGIITTIMEGARCDGDPREDIPASEAACVGFGVAADGSGNLYVTEGTRIRRIDAATGRIRTIAGNGNFSFCGDGGLAIRACIFATEVAVDAAGNVFFLDDGYDWRTQSSLLGERIRRVDATTGIVTTVAGNGAEFFCGDGGPAVAACLSAQHFTLDRDGAVLIASYGRVRRVDPRTGIITMVAGDPAVNCLSSDGSPAFDACAGAEAIDAEGRPLFLDWSAYGFPRVRRIAFACGDGVTDPGEACDDGNRIAGDGCDPNCTPTGCGNGVVTAGEGCDDGNVDGGDCCDATCQPRTGTPCNDGSACSTGDACDAQGRCAATTRGADAGPCATSICDPATGLRTVTPFPSTLPPGNPIPYSCDDGDLCTVGQWCFDGACSAGSPYASCDDHDVCTVDAEVCEPDVGCTHTPLAGPAGLVCRCEHVFESWFCDDLDDLPRVLRQGVKRVCAAVAKELALKPTTPRALRAAALATKRVTRTTDDFAHAAGFPASCASDVAGTLLEIVTRANEIATGAP